MQAEAWTESQRHEQGSSWKISQQKEWEGGGRAGGRGGQVHGCVSYSFEK